MCRNIVPRKKTCLLSLKRNEIRNGNKTGYVFVKGYLKLGVGKMKAVHWVGGYYLGS